jgi:hypothetical protein
VYDAGAGEVLTEGGFTLALFQGWDVGSEVLLEQVQLNFSFQNKFVILPCGLLVVVVCFRRVSCVNVLGYLRVCKQPPFRNIHPWKQS